MDTFLFIINKFKTYKDTYNYFFCEIVKTYKYFVYIQKFNCKEHFINK